ncbi:DUF3108 domain-containing protein [Candidatus Cardinium hertigii]|uniref:DUF3108 domain-containing protein n=1 Tax=Candidatus Cardinium hertigii TaxID=247481 RepID=UPI0013A54F41|nr:DUF3108 domain-containing protein [Candidatus Cardinium hertigii]
MRYIQKLGSSFLLLVGILCVQLQMAHTAVLPFQLGEALTYHAYFFGIQAGTATMQVDDQVHSCNEQSCYKIQVKGISNKAVALLGFKVSHSYESYLDVDARPHKFFARIQDNDYIREESINFDYKGKKANMTVAESTHNMKQVENYFPFGSDEAPIWDMVSMICALRSIDVSKLEVGQHLSFGFLLDGRAMQEGILFLGKKTITTKLGSILTNVFAPIIPTKGTIFAGERPIELFIADDAHKVPIKLRVNLIVGSVEMELASYKGLNGILFPENQ